MTGHEEGEPIAGTAVRCVIGSDQTDGRFSVLTGELGPRSLIVPHTHAREDECSFVLEGELMCYVGGQVVVAPAGSYVLKPRNVPHAFHNAGAETVRVMEILAPGGSFEGYFDEYEQIAAGGMDEDEHRRARAELGARYGITWHDERIPEIKDSFGIER